MRLVILNPEAAKEPGDYHIQVMGLRKKQNGDEQCALVVRIIVKNEEEFKA